MNVAHWSWKIGLIPDRSFAIRETITSASLSDRLGCSSVCLARRGFGFAVTLVSTSLTKVDFFVLVDGNTEAAIDSGVGSGSVLGMFSVQKREGKKRYNPGTVRRYVYTPYVPGLVRRRLVRTKRRTK
jgi:hypothetical protein